MTPTLIGLAWFERHCLEMDPIGKGGCLAGTSSGGFERGEEATSDIRSSSDKIPSDFTEEQKAAIFAEIALRSEGLVGVNHGSHQAAAEVLHNPTLSAYFDELGIEGWAVIDDCGIITSISTRFHGSKALGVYARDSLGTWVGSGKPFVWYTHLPIKECTLDM